jgi:hypothetical protein
MRKHYGLLTFALALAALCASCTPSSDDTHRGRPRIAIARLVIPTGLVIPWWSDIETTFLHDQLIDAVVHTDTLDVVERTRLDTILGEQELTKKEITDPNEAARLGKVVGANYFVLGTLADVELEKTARPLPYTTQAELNLHGRIKIDFRVVDVETSRVVASASEETHDEMRGVSGSEDKDDLKRFWERLRRQAAANIAQRIVDALVPIKLIRVSDAEVELSRGALTGIREGNLFDVFEMGEALKDPDTGRVVDRQQQRLGQIQVTSVDPGKATARVVSQTGTMRVGAVCRPVPPPPPAPVAGRKDPLQDRW